MNVEPGIRRTRSGWEVYVRIDGRYLSKHFKPDTDLIELRRWREERKARAKFKIPDPVLDGNSFGADCRRYLELVRGMTTYRDRAYRIGLWEQELGPGRPRKDITAVEIRRILERWRASGSSPGTLNLRRTALMHLFSVLDGKSAPNPVRDVPRYRESPPPLQLPTLKQATQAIAKLSPNGKSRYRLQVLLWTGWPPSQLMRITAADIDFRKQIARVPARRKGAGMPSVWLPLATPAVKALRQFKKAKAWGAFSTHSLRHLLHRACKAADVPAFNVYTLRHLFLTLVALKAKDDRAVAELAQHSDLRQTRRYTEQSVAPRLRAAVRKLR